MTKNILILGAGKSSIRLIKYLSDLSNKFDIKIIVAALDVSYFKNNLFKNIFPTVLDINDSDKLIQTIESSFIVVSMLPAFLHYKIAELCSFKGKNLITASYLTPAIKKLESEFLKKNCFLLMEMGLDPGMDHMSAISIIDKYKKDYKIKSFESYTGGLLKPNDSVNPWQYKFTWNPRNVILAGKEGATYLKNNKKIILSYNEIFQNINLIEIPGLGTFEGYANRDSIKYRDIYKIDDVNTLIRGTLRNKGFCSSWDIILKLGLTDSKNYLNDVFNMSHESFSTSKIYNKKTQNIKSVISNHYNKNIISEEIKLLDWLGLFSSEEIRLKKGTYAEILEHILKKKWTMKKNDIDRVVMFHRFKFIKNEKKKTLISFFHIDGNNNIDTAMAKSVGLPIGIFIKQVLLGKISLSGIKLPTSPTIYEPVLRELKKFNIIFKELIY